MQKRTFIKKLLLSFLFISTVFAKGIFLNKNERLWIKNRKTPVLIGITIIPNQILKTKNSYEGYFIDLFKIISNELNLPFKYVYFNTWNELIQAAKQRKIDIVFAAQKTPSRLKYLDFTDTVLVQKNNILENINNNKFTSVKDLINKKVAVTKGSAIEEYLKYNYPKIKLVLTKNELEALKLLNAKKVDAAIAESVRAGYYIKEKNLNNIIPGPSLGYNYFLSIASNSKEPMLNTLLTKAVNNIPKEKFKALKLKWGYLKEQIIFLNKQIIIYFLIALAIILPFSAYLYIINKQLKKEIKEKEEALKRIKMLRDSKLHQMNEIISMIAHQWKQPLNNLSLLIQILSKQYKKGELNKQTFLYFEENAKKVIDTLIHTITDFKELFKIEENKKIFNVPDIINQAVKENKIAFDKSGISIKIKAKEKEYLTSGYPKMFKQIVINILNNAKDALNEKNIKNKKIEIKLRKSDNKIILNISDNAGGIPIEIIDKIFEPYFSTKKNKNGTGLGLYMCKTILEEKMNSSIDVKNTKEGADFEITLPLV